MPSGVSYMLANRKAVKASLRRLYRSSRVLEVEHYGRALLATLTELAPSGRPEPAIALLAPGVYNSAFYEHMFLARELGAELVEGQDLLVKDGVVYMRTTKGLRRVDVIYRSWPDREDHESFLWQVSEHCRELHDLVAATYFDYALGESPAG